MKPDATVQTNDIPNSCVDCDTIKKVTVKYEIHPAKSKESKSLKGLPFAIAVDGEVLKHYEVKPDKAKDAQPSFSVDNIEVGSKVTLYLGSDAKAIYRTVPLYEVTADERNIKVVIKEKHGKHPSDTDTPILVKSDDQLDIYSAPLTGDIWMKFSHKFTSSEVDDLMPASISELAIQAVKDIYDGKFDAGKGTTLTINFEHPLKIIWSTSSNVKANVSSFNEREDVHTRVNPRTYAALIQAAELAEIDRIELSSGWRPMLGSVLHRIGLGLDVNVIVKDKKITSVRRSSATKNALSRAKLELSAAKKAKDQDRLKAAKENLAQLKKDYPAAIKEEAESTDPTDFSAFRYELANSKDIVKQIFDPWKMDVDATDDVDGTANLLTSGNETLHSNHLHITAVDHGLGYAPSFKPASDPIEKKGD